LHIALHVAAARAALSPFVKIRKVPLQHLSLAFRSFKQHISLLPLNSSRSFHLSKKILVIVVIHDVVII